MKGEIWAVIKKVKSEKATGPDGISVELSEEIDKIAILFN